MLASAMLHRPHFLWIGVIAIGVAICVFLMAALHHRSLNYIAKINRSETLSASLLLREVQIDGPRGLVDIRCVSGPIDALALSPVDIRDSSGPQLVSAKGDLHTGCITNGGYFDASFAPQGLFRKDGREISPIVDVAVENAAIVFSTAGAAPQIISIHSSAVASAATVRQCGPLLLGVTNDHPGNWTAQAARTALILSATRVGLLTTSPCSLQELQTVLATHSDSLAVPNVSSAVNLDGGPSSGMIIFNDGNLIAAAEPSGRVTDAIAMGR